MGPTSGPQFFLIECRLQQLQGFLHIDRTRQYEAPPTGRQAKKPTPPGFKQLDEALTRKLDALELSLLDVLADTIQWTAWGEHFAPLSGHQGKIREEGRRKILTTFAYGTGLGPTQTAKNIADISAPDRSRPRCARDRSVVLLSCIAALYWLPARWPRMRGLPPSRLPVELAAGFFLANLSGTAERSQTFEADLYLSFRWHDPRLAFDGTEPKRFLENAAIERLKEICGRSSSS